MDDEALWKRRFAVFALARLFGLATFLLGIGIAFSDLVRPGGSPVLGAVLIVAGVLDAVLAPKLLKKHWQTIDQQGDGGR